LYNAIAGSCAEQEANAGGIPVGPQPITLNQAYFSDNVTSGASAGIVPEIYSNVQFIDFAGGFTPPFNRAFATTPIELTTSLSTPTISAISTTETKSAYTVSATALIQFLNLSATGQPSPFPPNQNFQFEIFVNVGLFLQTPNGLNTLISYEIDSFSTNIAGIQIFPGLGHVSTSNFPLQNSLQISRQYPATGTNNNFNPASVSSNWGMLGTGILNASFVPGVILEPLNLFDMRARMGVSPAAGQVLTIRYKAVITNSSNNQEQAFHTLEITLT